ncbi:hypothetical protein EDC04DRAFT_2869041 [Pisolithus marmoratus]|nr:hypothetical protein EDC04DRAFT_2869041 [Pisolithus marmoratus]
MSWTNSSSPSPSLTTTTTTSRGVSITPAMAGSRFFPKSSTTANILSPPFASQISSGDPVRASVAHLLVRAYTLPCSTAAQAFSQLVQPTARFQLALDALLPLLNSSVELAQRILVSFILYSMYAPYPISLNPFKSALYATFFKERGHAAQVAAEGGFSENEQLVWVLWKILKGDGNDIGPYSPSTLTRSPLLPELRASNLFLEEETFSDSDLTQMYVIATFGWLPATTFDFFRDIPDLTQEGTAQEARILDLKGASADQSLIATSEPYISPEEDERNERIAHGMKLLLTGRDRTLTLTEQRILTPLIPNLTSPPVITSMDLPPIVAHNPNIAYQLVLALLTSDPLNAQPQGPSAYIDVLKHLPPTLPSFDLLVRLLQDTTTLIDPTTGGKTTVADVVHVEVLGRFIHESIKWLENADREEREGLISDDRFAKGVQNLCRFYTSLIRLSVVDTTSDADTTEMVHFTLRNARFEEANTLYRALATGRF